MEQIMKDTSRRRTEPYVWLVYGIALFATLYTSGGVMTLMATVLGSLVGLIASIFLGLVLLAVAAWDQVTAMKGVPGLLLGTPVAFISMGVLAAMSVFVGAAPDGVVDWLLLGVAASTYLVATVAAALMLGTLAKIRRREAHNQV